MNSGNGVLIITQRSTLSILKILLLFRFVRTLKYLFEHFKKNSLSASHVDCRSGCKLYTLKCSKVDARETGRRRRRRRRCDGVRESATRVSRKRWPLKKYLFKICRLHFSIHPVSTISVRERFSSTELQVFFSLLSSIRSVLIQCVFVRVFFSSSRMLLFLFAS